MKITPANYNQQSFGALNVDKNVKDLAPKIQETISRVTSEQAGNKFCNIDFSAFDGTPAANIIANAGVIVKQFTMADYKGLSIEAAAAKMLDDANKAATEIAVA